MAPTSCDQVPSLAEKLHAVGEPCFSVFKERRLAGVPPPEMGSDSEDSLAIPGDPEYVSSIKLLSEDGGSAAWLVANIRCTDDIVMARIPAWAGDDATSCIFPRQVQDSWTTETEYKPIDKSETGCLRITDVRGKGKGCVVNHAVPRGEVVERERACCLMPSTFLTPQQTAHALAQSMSPKQRAAFFELYNCKSADPNDALGIIRTNSFMIPGLPGHNALYTTVFETFSRINHRCGGFPFLYGAAVIINQIACQLLP